MRQVIHEHTETSLHWPGFISIAETGHGDYSVTVRNRSASTTSIIHIDRDQLHAMCANLMAHLGIEAPAPKVKKGK